MCKVTVEALSQGDIVATPTADMFSELDLSGRKLYYSQGYYGQGVIVAVIDSGCVKHPEFEDRLLPGTNMCTAGYCSNDSADNLGHGTHVCGTIAAKSCIAPKAQILPIKVFNALGQGKVTDVINAVRWATKWRGANGERVDIINMSLSSTGLTEAVKQEYEAAINAAVAAGIAVIVAAGNTGKEEILYPAYFSEVITVAAVDMDKKVPWFNTASKEVDMCQVGVNVLSTYVDGKQYKVDSGTSMAAPHVSGIAALMISKYKAVYGTYMPEASLFENLKMITVDVGDAGIDHKTGAGFCSLNPSVAGDLVVEMTDDDNNVMVDGKPLYSDQAPDITSAGRFVAPVRFLVEQLGGTASYDATLRKATFKIPR